MMVSIDKKEHLLKALAKGIRYDGRGLLEYRPVRVETGISKSAEGSARVLIGKTDVMVGVKMGIEKPYPDTPDQGNLAVNAELLAMSNPEFEPGPPGIAAVELARVVDKGIREAHALDIKKLCITPKEEVWGVMIDVCTINDDGDLLDASSLGALAALKNARFPKYEDKVVDYMEKTDKHVPLVREPLAVTIHKIGSYFLVDLIPDEEVFTDARLTVLVTPENTICALQKGGMEPLSVEDINAMVGIALKKAPELRSALR